MTLPASGQISMSQVNTELGYASNAQISLNDAAVRALAGIPSGAISLNDLHGKTFAYAVPLGLIMMSADGSIPSGWSRFSAADGYYIAGAGNSYGVGAAAQTWSSNTGTSSTTGSHNGHDFDAKDSSDSNRTYPADVVAGDHSHTVSVDSYQLPMQRMVLIKANAGGPTLPAYCMGFGTSTLSGFSVLSSIGFLNGYSSVGAVSESLSVLVSNSGSHQHGIGSCYSGSYAPTNSIGTSVHTHTVSASATQAIKRAVLQGLYKASAYSPVAGLIGMWEGVSPPSGWVLCDGNNGTVDLRDYFILFSTSGDGTRSGDNTVSFTITIGTNSWTHNHAGAVTVNGVNYYNRYWTKTVSHSHSCSNINANYTPSRYALTFIRKA